MSKLTAYCLKTKTKNVPFEGTPVINKNGNRYMAQGTNKSGYAMAKIMGEAAALEAIKSGDAKKGKGW